MGARLLVTGYEDPDLKDDAVDIAGCVRRMSSRQQLTSMGALRKWKIWRSDIENACLRAGGLGREVFVCAPREWDAKDARRIWRLRAPAYGLNDAPVAVRRVLRKCLVTSAESLSKMGLKFESW